MINTIRHICNGVMLCAVALLLTGAGYAAADQPFLPEPGRLVGPSRDFVPAYLKGMIVDPAQPFRIEFIMDPGHADYSPETVNGQALRQIHYFLSALTIPEQDQWVNLSPYEADRVMPESLGLTLMGRDLLAQDYLLKQVAASLMYPEEELGKEFWDRVYRKARDDFGTTEIPMDTFNKVWVVPQTAVIHEEGRTVLILESRLKVMLEGDYLAERAYRDRQANGTATSDGFPAMTADVIRDVIIPELEREVNHGKHFAPLRQIYHAMILATWYKTQLAGAPLHAAYVNQNKTAGIAGADAGENAAIYDRYVLAFQRGVYNYVKEDIDLVTHSPIPRKYFSGGMDMQDRPLTVHARPLSQDLPAVNRQGYLRVGVDVYPSFNPDDGVAGAMHDGHGVLYTAMKARLGRVAERYGWGRVFTELELKRTPEDTARLDKFFQLLVRGGIDHLAVLALQDRILPVNIGEWRLSDEGDRLGGLIVRHNGVLKILFPRSRLFAMDTEVLGDLLHELTEVVLLESGMDGESAHALALEINAVLDLNDPDDTRLALQNGVAAVNQVLDLHLGRDRTLPSPRPNPLSQDQLTRINAALVNKRERSITLIRRRIKPMNTLSKIIDYFNDSSVPDGTMRRIRMPTADMLAQIRDGVLDRHNGPVALFRLTGTEEWVLHKGPTAHKRTKIQLAQDLLPGYAYDVYLQNRPGQSGFALPEPDDLVDFGAEDVDKIHAVISAGGGLTLVDVRGMVKALSKEEILGMGRSLAENIDRQMRDGRSLEQRSGPGGEPLYQRMLTRELLRMQEEGMVHIRQVPWQDVHAGLFPPQTFILWEQFADPSFNVRKRAIALLFHLRDELGLESVVPIFNAVVAGLNEQEQLDLFDHRTYPFSGMVFMDESESGRLFTVSAYPVVRGVVSLSGWNSKTLWNYFMQQTRLRVMSKELLRRLRPDLTQKIEPMVNDPQIKDGLVIASRLSREEQKELGKEFLEAYIDQLKMIGRERNGEEDPLIAAAEELRRRWRLNGIVGAADIPAENPGGIDMDPRWLQWQRSGTGVNLDLPAGTAVTPPMNIKGLMPEIHGITPLPTLAPLLGRHEDAPVHLSRATEDR